MEDQEYETFDNVEEDLSVRALFVEQLPVEFPGEEPFIEDSFIWFVSKTGSDVWWAFGLSDDLTEPEEMLNLDMDLNINELRKFAIYLGEPWEEIEEDCPHCVINRHREAKSNMPLQIYRDMMERDDEKLAELRDKGRWEARAAFIEQATGVKLSLN